ncbi:hypothetical protein AOLI_G00152870 [Acnodon oligacanthus]
MFGLVVVKSVDKAAEQDFLCTSGHTSSSLSITLLVLVKSCALTVISIKDVLWFVAVIIRRDMASKVSLSGEQVIKKDDSLVPTVASQRRSDSPEPSCVSMKSERSMDFPLDFRKDERSPAESLIESATSPERSNSPEPSCVSIKSDRSMDFPLDFKKDECSAVRVQKEASEMNCISHLESLFKELENKIISLVKKELKKFKKLLSTDYPACSERQVEDEEEHSSAREGVLNVTLNILRTMKQPNLAYTLQTKLVSVYQQKLKSKLMEKCKRITEGNSQSGTPTLLNEIYTELYITEGGSGEVNNEHENGETEGESSPSSPRAVNESVELNVRVTKTFKVEKFSSSIKRLTEQQFFQKRAPRNTSHL